MLVLSHWNRSPLAGCCSWAAVAAVAAEALLSEIRDASDDPSYWEEVMQVTGD